MNTLDTILLSLTSSFVSYCGPSLMSVASPRTDLVRFMLLRRWLMLACGVRETSDKKCVAMKQGSHRQGSHRRALSVTRITKYTKRQVNAKKSVDVKCAGPPWNPNWPKGIIKWVQVIMELFWHNVRWPTQFVCPNSDTICPNNDVCGQDVDRFLKLGNFASTT